MKSNPAATNSSRIPNEAASSSVQPRTLPPKHSGAVWIPDWPSLRFSMEPLLAVDLDIFLGTAIADGDHDAKTQRDGDSDQRPGGADARQNAHFPQRRQHSAQEDDKSDKVHARPFHDFPPLVVQK